MKLSPAACKAAASGDIHNLLVAMMPGGIEMQEKQGQMEQAMAQTLPLNLQNPEDFKAAGFVFGKPVDDIFQEATFPPGWKKEPTDHSMWSDIVDDKGRKRGAIFYKAAFYDRSAHAALTPRFYTGVDYGDSDLTARIRDVCGLVDHKIEGIPQPDWNGDSGLAREACKKRDDACEELSNWLNTNYPDWYSAGAYWD